MSLVVKDAVALITLVCIVVSIFMPAGIIEGILMIVGGLGLMSIGTWTRFKWAVIPDVILGSILFVLGIVSITMEF